MRYIAVGVNGLLTSDIAELYSPLSLMQPEANQLKVFRTCTKYVDSTKIKRIININMKRTLSENDIFEKLSFSLFALSAGTAIQTAFPE